MNPMTYGEYLEKEMVRVDTEIKELEEELSRKFAEEPRWLRWLMRKLWPSIFRDL